eukprot:2394592-Pyramimonas_sp.AAC.1
MFGPQKPLPAKAARSSASSSGGPASAAESQPNIHRMPFCSEKPRCARVVNKTRRNISGCFRPLGAVAGPLDLQTTTQNEKAALGKRWPGTARRQSLE